MELILPLIVYNTVSYFFVLVVSDKKDIVKLIRDEIFKIIYFLRGEKAVIGWGVNLKNWVEKVIEVLFSVLYRLNPDFEAELFPLSL